MPSHDYPGVYLEKVPGEPRQIVAVTTSVTAFVGKAKKGPVGKALRVESFHDYKKEYGKITSESDAMGLAIQAFFFNGGKSAYICRLAGGSSDPANANDFTSFYKSTLGKIRDVSIVVLPGEHWAKYGSGNPIISATLAHCEKMENRMVIIDPPPDLELQKATTVADLALPASAYSVLYYPWVNVANPLHDNEKNPNARKTVSVAPSAFAAGMWSSMDKKRGVWKAPAGIEAKLVGATGLGYLVEEDEQGQLNPLGVNCIRNISGAGLVIWGARTLATQADPEWRYVPVKRTAIMIEQSINHGIQWAVFEPNDQGLWSGLRSSVGAFMQRLFRAGAFQGDQAKDAYFVRCGLGDTMTQADADAGLVIIMVGFAPIKPAEFVILRIQLKLNKQQWR